METTSRNSNTSRNYSSSMMPAVPAVPAITITAFDDEEYTM